MENSIIKTNSLEQKSGEKFEQLFDHCFEIKKIEKDDHIIVGGNNLWKDKTKISCDLGNFKDFFDTIHNRVEGANLVKIKEQFLSKGIEINERLYAKLFFFTKEYLEKYPINQEGEKLREQFYKQEKDGKLSEIFKKNSAECAEIAILAQFYLQQEDVQSSYFSGEVVWDKDDEEGCNQHTFIIIKNNNRTYIYDPANPVDGKLPNICTVDKDFDKEVRLNKKDLLQLLIYLRKKKLTTE